MIGDENENNCRLLIAVAAIGLGMTPTIRRHHQAPKRLVDP